jgi:hypothetical protein
MPNIARSAVRLFSTACALTLVSVTTACSSTTGQAGMPAPPVSNVPALSSNVAPMSSTVQQKPPAKAKNCCLVVVSGISFGVGDTAVYHNAKMFKKIGPVKNATQNPNPQAAAVSKAGVVYVSDLGTQTVYAYGHGYSRAPTAQYPQSSPSGVAVPRALTVGKDGTLYVADEIENQGKFVANVVQVYPPGSSQPSLTLQGPPNAIQGAGVATDAQDNVYIAAQANSPSDPSQEVVQVIKYPPGSNTGQLTNLTAPPYFSRAIAIDGSGNILIGDVNASCGAVFVFPPGATTPSRIIGTQCSSGSEVSGVALGTNGSLYVADSEGDTVQQYSYATGKLLGALFVPNVFSVVGIAEGPAIRL